MALVAPMPSASISSATNANDGLRASARSASRISWRMTSILFQRDGGVRHLAHWTAASQRWFTREATGELGSDPGLTPGLSGQNFVGRGELGLVVADPRPADRRVGVDQEHRRARLVPGDDADPVPDTVRAQDVAALVDQQVEGQAGLFD